ncbi:PPC domain-containing protein [Kribbella italica]|uniref:Peptidase C-terminal archaeal/bacterial domain-containing protein n=1 Tax=Kribbella italica TaxID=1540520 RepID=A0A7W9MZQ5_9ACTN|nr:PPC domain-containing protein [Kribbella italica]MBB5841488.1 hypothetical protein [Kribbella italica]
MNPRIRRTLLAASAAVVAVSVAGPAASATGTGELRYTENEAATAAGHNDSTGSAQRLQAFGTGWGQKKAATVNGTLSPAPVALPEAAEDNGSIPLASATGIGTNGRAAITTTGQLGDGPHGGLGDRTGDFDFFKVTGTAGRTLTATTDGSSAGTNTVVGVYSAAGQLLASDDDGGFGLQGKVTYKLPSSGDYYVVVAGKSAIADFPADPNNSGSGPGDPDTGAYQVLIAVAPVDKDFYGVHLAKGDVFGGSLATSGSRLTVRTPNGATAISSDVSTADRRPAASPLPTGLVDVSYVAPQSGWYTIAVTDGFGPYELQLGVSRPGTELNGQQTIFLDFDGGQIDTAPLGGAGVGELSGLSAYLGNWGLTAADESAVISKVVATVNENVKTDPQHKGSNPNTTVKLRNSRDDADTFGSAGVSRVVVGGQFDQSGLGQIGSAQSIDPGNFAREETALVQLDLVSLPEGAFSFNQYLTERSNRVAFVGQALGNLVSREIGHLAGANDTDGENAVVDLMDADGNFAALYGVGADGIGGTRDDKDVDFGKDAFSPATGLTGTQDSLNLVAWGLTKPC